MKALSPLKKFKAKVVLAPILKLFECVLELMMPFLVKYIIDKGIANGDMNYTLTLSLLLFVIAILGFACTMIAQYLASKVASDYGYEIRKELFLHLTNLKCEELDKYNKDKVLTILTNDAFNMQNGVMMFMRLILRAPFLLIGSTIISFTIDYRSGLIFLLTLIGCALTLFLIMTLSPKKYRSIQEELDNIQTETSDTLSGARVIRAFNKESDREEKFNQTVSHYKNKGINLAKLNSLLNPLTFFFVNLGIILVVYLGYKQIPEGRLTTGDIVSLISYLVSSLAALIMFSRLILSLNKAHASNKRINEFFKLEEKEDSLGEVISNYEEMIRFNNVSFKYSPQGKDVIKNICFYLNKGETIAFIGGTGSGKSTVISLIERLYENYDGEILYKGNSILTYDLNSLRDEINLVFLKPSLFKGTIKENLTLGGSTFKEEDIIAALKASLAYDFVMSYEDKLEHEVLDNGSNFSGGQKQRLLLARAFLKNKDLLILDDTMSALDYLSERKILEYIDSLKCSKIIISQRISTIRHASRIYVFDKGEIIDSGTHEELLRTCQIYQQINEIEESTK